MGGGPLQEVTPQGCQFLGAYHSIKIAGNFGPKLNETVQSNWKILGKEDAPFEVDHLFG